MTAHRAAPIMARGGTRPARNAMSPSHRSLRPRGFQEAAGGLVMSLQKQAQEAQMSRSLLPAARYGSSVVAGLFCLLVQAFVVPPVTAQTQFETVKTFAGGTDGFMPAGPLAQGADGWIYGLTDGYGTS